MTNEIKEILNWLFGEYPEEELILEDYITNLQQRLDKAKNYILENMLDYSQARKDLLDIINDK